jgi:N-acetylglucosaminyldiphosphoundecaprenol N-acetyl-beta-D-mannosaminyltransferase
MNFVAETVRRAPVWMQRSGLEWLWRIKEEPALWRRYWRDGLDFIRLLATRVLPYAWYRRRYPLDAVELARASARLLHDDGIPVIRIEGAWGRDNLAPLRQCCSRAVQAGRNIRLDLTGVSHVDSAFVGLVMLLYGHQTSRGAQLLIGGLQPHVKRVFELSCAEYMLPE